MIPSIVKVFIPALLAFLVGFAITPGLTRWMYRARMWKRKSRIVDNDPMSEAFQKIKNAEGEEEMRTPRLGGIIVWGSVAITTLLLFLVSRIAPGPSFAAEIDYISRSQTLLPFLALILGAGFGLLEDIVEIYIHKFKKLAHGLGKKYTIGFVVVFAAVFASWFYFRLDYREVFVPFAGLVKIGWVFIPFFMLTVLGTFSSRVIDGLDGLAGGVLSIIYGAFGLIAIMQDQFDIAAFCFVVASGLLVFLWYNVPKAKFYLAENGMMGLTLALPIVAFLLHRSLWILIIGFPLVITAFSSFIQIMSKKFWNKKVFKVAPLHHHFQALGWSAAKVVMRYWIATLMISVAGVILAYVG